MGNQFSQKKRIEVFEKTNGKCWYCGCDISLYEMQIDHIHPRFYGGKNNIENLAPTCSSCNSSKCSTFVEDFRKRISLYPEKDLHVSQYLKMAMIDPKPIVFYFERMDD